MKKHAPMLTTFAFILACGAAVAEESPGMRGHEGQALIGQGGMMGRGGMMGWWRHDGARSRYALHLRSDG